MTHKGLHDLKNETLSGTLRQNQGVETRFAGAGTRFGGRMASSKGSGKKVGDPKVGGPVSHVGPDHRESQA